MPDRIRSYRVAGVGQPEGKKPGTYKITIPPRIARLIPAGTEFIPEWHEDGILLRRVEAISEPVIPSWAEPGEQP